MTARDNTKLDLSNIPLFEGIEDTTIIPNVEDWIFFYNDGQKICAQGEPADSMVVILRGEVRILSQDTFLVTRRATDVVGEQGFLSPGTPRTADAVACGRVEVLRIPYLEIRRLQATSHQFTRNLLAIVSAKLAEATSERAFRYRNEHRLISAFNSHLAPNIAARLLRSGEDHGNPRLIQGVVLFADIRGFTTTSLTLPPDALASQLGEYLDEMVKTLPDHHAYVDKFIGDAVMGVWGFPFEVDNQASEALAARRRWWTTRRRKNRQKPNQDRRWSEFWDDFLWKCLQRLEETIYRSRPSCKSRSTMRKRMQRTECFSCPICRCLRASGADRKEAIARSFQCAAQRNRRDLSLQHRAHRNKQITAKH